jgi:predicted nucleic acid-binding protein
MTAYYDTSALIRLYVVEDYTEAITTYTTTQGKSIAIHDLHVLELENGLRAKVFRKEMTKAQCREVISRMEKDMNDGLLARLALNWHDVFHQARRVSSNITERSGCCSLDILHIAAALHWSCPLFVSLDDRQIKAATLARLKVLDIRTP